VTAILDDNPDRVRETAASAGRILDPYDLVWLDEDDQVIRRVAAAPESA
jgi:hypothetical protein